MMYCWNVGYRSCSHVIKLESSFVLLLVVCCEMGGMGGGDGFVGLFLSPPETVIFLFCQPLFIISQSGHCGGMNGLLYVNELESCDGFTTKVLIDL